jgi:hypothetical protein
MAKKTSTGNKKPGAAVTLALTLDDLKKITDGGSSFGGDTWQQIKWGKIAVGIEPIEARASSLAKKRAKKKTTK